MEKFGKTVRELRESMTMTREELCGDETELSVRQLSRIELGHSVPNLTKAQFIADKLGVSLGQLTDENLELPKRYTELKYLILRTPVYTDADKIKERESQFDEIAEVFYHELPEDEKLIVDSLQATFDTHVAENVDFSFGLLDDYLEQIKLKSSYNMNDLILLNLYLMCYIGEREAFDETDELFIKTLLGHLLEGMTSYSIDELFIVSKVLIGLFRIHLSEKDSEHVALILDQLKKISDQIHDFNRKPILLLMEWKYALICLEDSDHAQKCFNKAIVFAQMMEDEYLEKNLMAEWEMDSKK